MTGYQSKRAAAQEKLTQSAQEPVAFCMHWQDRWGCNHYVDPKEPYPENAKPLYTTPPQRPWVDLTDEMIEELFQSAAGADEETHIRFARAIENALRSKNT